MLLKHTPGPWKWAIMDYSMAVLHMGNDAELGCIMSVGPCSSCLKRIKQLPESERIFKWGICHTPVESNARLIAAAPEMLEALINITTNMRNEEPILIDIDIIIEKATGMKIEDILK